MADPKIAFPVTKWLAQTSTRQPLLVILLALAGFGLASRAFHWSQTTWQGHLQPALAYRRAIHHGIAVSLNNLERQQIRSALPSIKIRGAVWDGLANDWVVFGDAAPGRAPIPLAALALALRAVRNELDPPGIDIRPALTPPETLASQNQVTYFGGVRQSIVGQWFFELDHWMKRASLAEGDLLPSGVSSYWDRAVASLERETSTCRHDRLPRQGSHSRFWLSTAAFNAIEQRHVLVFLKTPLRISAETTAGPAGYTAAPTSLKTADPLAEGFAAELTQNLGKLPAGIPITQIEDFAVLVAAFSWLAGLDPYRDLRPWAEFSIPGVATPDTVSNLVLYASRQHHGEAPGVTHRHSLRISGGVIIAPTVRRHRSANNALDILSQAILGSRPSAASAEWRFAFLPPTP